MRSYMMRLSHLRLRYGWQVDLMVARPGNVIFDIISLKILDLQHEAPCHRLLAPLPLRLHNLSHSLHWWRVVMLISVRWHAWHKQGCVWCFFHLLSSIERESLYLLRGLELGRILLALQQIGLSVEEFDSMADAGPVVVHNLYSWVDTTLW